MMALLLALAAALPLPAAPQGTGQTYYFFNDFSGGGRENLNNARSSSSRTPAGSP